MADAQFCLLAIEHWSTCLTKGEWSGWMQAIGSVAAIGAGVAGLAYQTWQQRRALRTQKIRDELEVVSEHRELLEEALAVVVAAKNQAGAEQSYRKYLLNDSESDRFNHTVQLVKDTDRTQVPGAGLKVYFSIAQDAMADALAVRSMATQWAHHRITGDFATDRGSYTGVIYRLLEAVNRFDHHLMELRDFAGLADLDQVDHFRFLSRAERERLKA
jgi:hypothetical protein